MKFKELTAVNAQEREKKLEELRQSKMAAEGQRATGTSPKNPHELKNIRKTIARILTLKAQDKTKGGAEQKNG